MSRKRESTWPKQKERMLNDPEYRNHENEMQRKCHRNMMLNESEEDRNKRLEKKEVGIIIRKSMIRIGF